MNTNENNQYYYSTKSIELEVGVAGGISDNLGYSRLNSISGSTNLDDTMELEDQAQYQLMILVNYLNQITIPCLYMEMALCFLFNTISLTFIIYKRIFTPINILIANLSLADIVYSSCIPFLVQQFSASPISQSVLGCAVFYVLDVSSMMVIVFTIAALTIERFFCLKDKKPIETDQSIKVRLIAIYIGSLWLLSIAYTMPKALSITAVTMYNESVVVCGSTYDPMQEKMSTITKLVIAFAIPFTLIISVSIMLLKFLSEWSRKSSQLHATTQRPLTPLMLPAPVSGCCLSQADQHQQDQQQQQQQPQQQHRKHFSLVSQMKKWSSSPMDELSIIDNRKMSQMTRTQARLARIRRRTTRFVLAVVFSFLCCWTPLWIYQLFIIFSDSSVDSKILQMMNNLNLIVVYLGGVLNPLLFILLTENFRQFATGLFGSKNRLLLPR